MTADGTGRIEAFSDGVFAIAMTLLVLDIKVPHDLTPDRTLAQALVGQWPTYLAFATSFATILIMWVNHHRLFTHIGRGDDGLLFCNGLLLLGVVLVPFPTALVSEYLGRAGQKTAALIYNSTFIAIALCFNLLWRSASTNGVCCAPIMTARPSPILPTAFGSDRCSMSLRSSWDSSTSQRA